MAKRGTLLSVITLCYKLNLSIGIIAAPYESSNESSGFGMLDLWALVT